MLGKQLPPPLCRRKLEITQNVGQSSEGDYETESNTVSYSGRERRKKSLIPETHKSIVEDIAYVVLCTIWYHLHNFKNVKNTHGGVFNLVKLQASTCNFTKISTLPWLIFPFFKLYKWCQIAQRITYHDAGKERDIGF